MSLSGGPITLLYPSYPNSQASGGGSFGITVIGNDLFWIDPNAGSGTATAIFKAPKVGQPETITTVCNGCGMVDGGDITTDGTKLYIAEEFGGKVLVMNTDGSGLVGLGNFRYSLGFAAETFWTLAEHDGIVYLSDRGNGNPNGRIQSIPVTGGTYTTLHEESRLTFLPLGTAILHPPPADTTAPTLSVPINITLEAPADTTPANTGTATATDDTDPNPTVTFSDVTVPGTGQTIETITRTWTATDISTNSVSADQIITVKDTNPPGIPQPLDVSVFNDPGLGSAIVTFSAPEAFDAVDGLILSICTPASGSTFVFLDTTVTCTATDAAGNSDTASFTVFVFDNEPPVITISSVAAPTDGFLASQTVTTFPGTVGTQPTTVTGTVSDNVGVFSVDVNGVTATVVSGSWTATGISLNGGGNTITSSAFDIAGNTAFTSVQLTLDLDLDGDDIQNNVDGTISGQTPVSEVNDPSDNFSDELLGGTTSGNIQQRGEDRVWSISDEPDDPTTTTEIEGLRIIVGPGIETAKAQGSGNCTPKNPVLNFAPSGADIVLTCGSTIVEVNSGGVEIIVTVDSLTITVDVGEDGSVTLDETDEQTIEISNTGTEPIVLTVNGVSSTVGAGKQQTTTQILIDIKPGSDPNSINPNSNGVIPVAILSTEDFDATAVDVSTIKFGPKQVTESHGIGHTEDVNGDDLDDLVLHFKTQDVGITDETELCVSAQTVDEVIIVGCDAINLVGGNNSNNGKGPKNK